MSDANDWTNLRPAPRMRAGHVVALLLGCLALAGFSYAVMVLIGAAWTECAALDAGGRASLAFFYLPLTVTATAVAAAITVHLTKRLGWITRVVLVVAAVLLAAILVVMWSVPVGGYEDWPGGPGTAGSAQCGPGGIPTWWPRWLPS